MLHLIMRRGWVCELRIEFNIVMWEVISSSRVRLIVDWLLGVEGFSGGWIWMVRVGLRWG